MKFLAYSHIIKDHFYLYEFVYDTIDNTKCQIVKITDNKIILLKNDIKNIHNINYIMHLIKLK